MFSKIKTFILIILFFAPFLSAHINLVWQGDRHNMWEESWLMELMAGLKFNIIDDGRYEKIVDNAIIIGHDGRRMDAYTRKLHARGYTFGIIFLSDEQCLEKTNFYRFAKFVFRNICHSKFNHYRNVVIFPLGYKNKFWQDGYKEIKPASQRHYTWCFAGRIGPHRREMIRNMRNIPNHFVHEIIEWNDKRSLSTRDYRDTLLESIFVPCPGGAYTHDNFRLYESLECGCIPIIERKQEHYFRQLCGEGIPFVVINRWHEANRIINDYLSNQERLEQKRIECHKWWYNKKKEFHTKFINIIKENLHI